MGRGFEVISALAEVTRTPPFRAGVSAVAARLGRDRSQVSRALASLEVLGFVVRAADRAYRLSWNWYAAAQELTDRRLRVDGLDLLEQLSETSDEACFLGVLEGDSTVTIVESIPPASRMIGSWIGRAYPAFCSDAGQAVLWDATDDEIRAVFTRTDFRSPGPNAPASVDDFLARLDAARERGFAIVDEEAEPGLYSVSAPVRDFRGEVVAGVQIVGMREALRPRTDELGALCVGAADALSRRIGAPTVASAVAVEG